jgi:lipopolysaccharide/colanic/teichoic acid biosynthesis glycosyltransferase
MPTKHQILVKVNTNVNSSHAETDAVARSPAADSEASTKVARSARVLPLKAFAQAPSRTQSDVRSRSGARARTDRIAYEAVKRIIDLAIGLPLLLIATPIILVSALAIRLDTKGAPFFIQTRLGMNGRPFKIVKLRGMFIDSRTRFASYYDYAKHTDLEFYFHHEEDPRITRAGKFMRRMSIDELPNLWNVVRGEMSLVGPRPEIPELLPLYGHHREQYLSVKPGVTCLSKCTGRDRLTKRETIDFDLTYIRDRCLGLDFRILWRTFRGVVLRRDVF